MELVTDIEISPRATFVRLGLKMKAVREAPEGLCERCQGTGNGEEIADLGEARFHSSEFPVKQCRSCGGSGMTIAQLKITSVGLLLLSLVPVAIWVFPWRMQLILVSSVVSLAALDAIRGLYQNNRTKVEPEGVEQSIGIAPVANAAGPRTAQILSLGNALQKDRRTADSNQPEPIVVSQTESESISKSV